MRLRTLPPFEYLAPKDLSEVCSALKDHGERARILAGGTDLLLAMKQRTCTPQLLIGLKQVPGLDQCSSINGQGVTLGALATHQSVVENQLIRTTYGALWKACSLVGTPNIRSMGTIGGNLCNGSPSADTAPPLIAYGATLKLRGVTEERTLPLESFFLAPGKTALLPGELLVSINLPALPARTGVTYVKLTARVTVDIAAVCVAASITIDADETCRDACIVLGAVAPTPFRAKGAEALLMGERLQHTIIEKAALRAAEEARPISDLRASAGHRTEMVAVLTREALDAALAQAKAV
jgi:CO/xanthine dehydrogenase FAD-binding subunit